MKLDKPEDSAPAVSSRGFLWTRIAAGALVLAYAFVLAFGSRAGFPSSLSTGAPFPFLSDQPVGEDGYYLMLAAWNLGAGHGLTANFGEVITGVQPLMTLALAGLAATIQGAGGEKFDFARAMILFGGANTVLLAALVSNIARRATAKPGDAEIATTIAFLGACLSFYIFRTATYGLETGLYLVLVALVLRASLTMLDKGRPLTTGGAVWIGFLVGLCGLARIDFGLVAAVAFGVLLIQRKLDVTRALLAGLVALAVTSPWFLWVRSVSGTFMPTSGPAQAEMVNAGNAWGRAEAMLAAVLQNVSPWLPTFGEIWPGIAGVVAIAILWLLVVRTAGTPMFRAGSTLLAWAIAVGLLPVVYFAFFWAGHFYARYTAPVALVALTFTAVLAAHVAPPLRRPLVYGAFVTLAAANAFAAWKAHHSGSIGDGHSVAAGYVAREIPSSAKVGAFQSGVVGFYNPNVINLDGKVNQAALIALREKRMEEYLDRAGIDYVIDWEGVIHGLMPRAMASGEWTRCPKPVGNLETICVMRRKLSTTQE